MNEKIKSQGQMYRERVCRYLQYGALPRIEEFIHSIPHAHAILNFISNLPNPSNTVLLQKPEVDSEPRN